jgi:hypothetical protein
MAKVNGKAQTMLYKKAQNEQDLATQATFEDTKAVIRSHQSKDRNIFTLYFDYIYLP